MNTINTRQRDSSLSHSGCFRPCPKPSYRKSRNKRKRDLKSLDKQIQIATMNVPCVVANGCIGQTSAHHVVTRSDKSKRHDPNNLIPLCVSCHRRFHDNPVKFCQEEKIVLPHAKISTMEKILSLGLKNGWRDPIGLLKKQLK